MSAPKLFRATVRGVPDVVVLRMEGKDFAAGYRTADYVGDRRSHTEEDVTDRVPLLLITEDDARHVVEALDDGYRLWAPSPQVVDRLRAQLESPRMEEPSAFGAMVEASPKHGKTRLRWIRCASARYWRSERGHLARWGDLIDPRTVGGDR